MRPILYFLLNRNYPARQNPLQVAPLRAKWDSFTLTGSKFKTKWRFTLFALLWPQSTLLCKYSANPRNFLQNRWRWADCQEFPRTLPLVSAPDTFPWFKYRLFPITREQQFFDLEKTLRAAQLLRVRFDSQPVLLSKSPLLLSGALSIGFVFQFAVNLEICHVRASWAVNPSLRCRCIAPRQVARRIFAFQFGRLRLVRV